MRRRRNPCSKRNTPLRILFFLFPHAYHHSNPSGLRILYTVCSFPVLRGCSDAVLLPSRGTRGGDECCPSVWTQVARPRPLYERNDAQLFSLRGDFHSKITTRSGTHARSPRLVFPFFVPIQHPVDDLDREVVQRRDRVLLCEDRVGPERRRRSGTMAGWRGLARGSGDEGSWVCGGVSVSGSSDETGPRTRGRTIEEGEGSQRRRVVHVEEEVRDVDECDEHDYPRWYEEGPVPARARISRARRERRGRASRTSMGTTRYRSLRATVQAKTPRPGR